MTDLPKVIFNYHSARIETINTIHTVQANLVSDNNSIIIDGVSYTLTQFYFHAPSEHTINGESYSMELHLVHADTFGNLAVVGVMIKNGAENQVLSPLWNSFFSNQNLKQDIGLVNLLPKESSIYRYNGSLTTPPCTEGVTWIVMETPIELSETQIHSFESVFPPNNRPLQPLNGRDILKYL